MAGASAGIGRLTGAGSDARSGPGFVSAVAVSITDITVGVLRVSAPSGPTAHPLYLRDLAVIPPHHITTGQIGVAMPIIEFNREPDGRSELPIDACLFQDVIGNMPALDTDRDRKIPLGDRAVPNLMAALTRAP